MLNQKRKGLEELLEEVKRIERRLSEILKIAKIQSKLLDLEIDLDKWKINDS